MNIPHWLGQRMAGSALCVLAVLGVVAGWGAPAWAGEDGSDPRPVVTSAAEIDYPPFSFSDMSGKAQGFSVALMRAALKAVGRDVTYRMGPWAEVKGWLETGQVEALPLVGRTPEREARFDFTFPYMTLHGAIVVRKDTTDIRTLADLKGRRVAVMRGDNAEEFLRREPQGMDIHTTTTFDDALRQLSQGRFDAVVMQRLVALGLIKKAGLSNLTVMDRPVKGFRQDFCFAVKEGDRETLALLNEGLALVMADGTYSHLRAHWFAAMDLPIHRRLIVGGDENYPPFEYRDREGNPTGFNVDLIRAVAQAVGLDIEVRLGPWAQVRDQLARGEIDAVEGMLYSPERDLAYDFTAPFMFIHYVAVVREGEGPPPDNLAQLRDKRIIVQRGDLMHDYALEHDLDGNLTVVSAQEDVLRELANGKHDCALVSRLTALYWIDRYGWKNLTVGRRPFISTGYCFAVPPGQRDLLAQLGEGLKVLEENGEYRRIYEKWLGVYDKAPSVLFKLVRYFSFVFIPLLVLLVAILLWSWSLRRQVRRRTAELRSRERQYRLLADNTLDVIWVMNLDLEFTYVNPVCFEMVGFTAKEWIGSNLQDHCDAENFIKMAGIVAEALADPEQDGRVIFEAEMLHRNGRPVPVEVHGRVIFDADGQPLRLQGTTRDITDRKMAEARLVRSEALLQDTQRIGKIGGWDWDVRNQDLYWSEETYRIHDLEPDDENLAGEGKIQRSLACYHEEDREVVGAAFSRCVEEGEPYELECRFTSAKGRELWVRTAGQAIKEDGQVVRVVGSLQDVTDFKRNEEQLLNQNRLIKAILDNLSLGVAINTMDDGMVTYINKSFEDIYGWPAAELEGVEDYFEKVYPDPAYRREVKERVMADIASGVPERMAWDDLKPTGKDGSVRIVSAKNIPLPDQNIMISTVQDITERRLAEQAQMESEKRFRLLVESSPDAMYVQTNLRFAYLNPVAVQAFGAQDRAELIGQPVMERFHPDFHEPILERTRLLSQRKQAVGRQEQRFLKMDGTVFDVEVEGVPITWEGVDGALIFFRDIGDRVRAQAEREALEEQLRQSQKLESVGRLAGGVAHDFNNLLGVILGYTELALEDVEGGTQAAESLGHIQYAGTRAKELTRQLLAFGRKQVLRVNTVNLNKIVTGVDKMLRRLIGEDVHILVHLDPDIGNVDADTAMMEQILLNLAVNARDAMPEGGTLTIETQIAVIGDNYALAHAGIQPGEYVMVAVSDTGHGMDAATREKVFEPFFTTKEKGHGTGLGLATVYGIVKQHNGSIWVYSEPGQGTTVKLYLPVSLKPETKTAAVPLEEAEPTARETVLLVEDDDALRHMVKKALARAGYQMLVADSPEQAIALEAGHAGDIDLLLSDVVMPEMNGKVLYESLSAARPGLRVLFMSGYTENVIAHKGILKHGIDFIQKPFSIKDLKSKVREALKR